MHLILMILAFHLWFPLGLAALAFFLVRRARWRRAYLAGDGPMMRFNGERWERRIARAQDKMERLRERAGRRGWNVGPTGSGNAAFDEYRDETLRRLEDEQREFKGFLDSLRMAKDRAEFDQFMAARRSPPAEPQAEPPASQG